MLDEPELLRLLHDAPAGEYLLESRDGWRLLWRLTEGCPEDEALEPAGDWTLDTPARSRATPR